MQLELILRTCLLKQQQQKCISGIIAIACMMTLFYFSFWQFWSLNP
jgi:hypothetical protein